MNETSKPQPNDPRVGAALREYFERVDRGERIDGETFILQHAEIAEELRTFLLAEHELRKLAAESNVAASISTKSVLDPSQETIPPRTVRPAEPELSGQFGRYRILRQLGSGAMGAVYLAEDTQLARQVAIKTPHFQNAPTPETIERFYREARAAAKLRNPNVCPVYDVGEIGGRHYISMAYIEGKPLSALIQPKPLPERQILTLIRKLALALQEAHDQGIVHRDLKPANIMVDKKGEPLITDFGLASQKRRDDDIRLTHSGALIGTPAYMSPEQVEGDTQKVDSLTDQYSLGVILFELLTGQLPFRGSVIAVMGQIITKEPPRPSELRPGLDLRIEAVCLKMLSKAPAARFPSMSKVADELLAILKNSPPKPATAVPQKTATTNQERNAGQTPAFDIDALEGLADKCLARRDYEQVIKLIEQVPEQHRSQRLLASLDQARNKSDEITYLLCEIDDALRANDRRKALAEADKLLKIKPGHRRALAVRAKLLGPGEARRMRVGPLQAFQKPWSDGGWIPWSALAFGLVVFGVMSFCIAIYLRSGKAIVKVEVMSPDVAVTLNGSTLTLAGPGSDVVQVEPGESELTITHGNLKFTTKSFALKRGENETIRVSIVDAELVTRFGDEILDSRPITPAPITPAPIAADSSKQRQASTPSVVPPSSNGPLIATLKGHRASIRRRIEISPDNRWIVSCSDDKTVRIWNAATGAEEKVIHGAFNSAAFAPDGKTLLLGHAPENSEKQIQLLAVPTWEVIKRFRDAGGAVNDLAFDASGKRFASAHQAGIKVWDVERDTPLLQSAAPAPNVYSVAFTPDQKSVFGVGFQDGHKIFNWNAANGELLNSFKRPGGDQAVLSPDGTWLVAADWAGGSRILEFPSGTERRRIGSISQGGSSRGIAISPDGRRILVGGTDSFVRLFDVETRQELATFGPHNERVGCVSISPNGQFAVTACGEIYENGRKQPGTDFDIRIWRLPDSDRN